MPTDLAELPVQDGFRLRGESVTRLETFVDAAFAFAVTMTVISVGTFPNTVDELELALHRAPTFVFTFLILIMFWIGHNRWSRRYELETARTTALSLGLVLLVLIWLYPLRMVIAGALGFMTGGWVPSEMSPRTVTELQDCFLIYGAGFAALSLILIELHRAALGAAGQLGLDELERLETRREIGSHAILLGSALLSMLLTCFVRTQNNFLAVLPGFVYGSIGPAMYFHHARFHRLRQALPPRANVPNRYLHPAEGG